MQYKIQLWKLNFQKNKKKKDKYLSGYKKNYMNGWRLFLKKKRKLKLNI